MKGWEGLGRGRKGAERSRVEEMRWCGREDRSGAHVESEQSMETRVREFEDRGINAIRVHARSTVENEGKGMVCAVYFLAVGCETPG